MGRATKTRLTFDSGGEPLVGNLFLPDGAEPAGIVVAVGPLTSVKEQAAGTYAKAMAERGYAALAFDYRYFGESGGRPRFRCSGLASVLAPGRWCVRSPRIRASVLSRVWPACTPTTPRPRRVW